MSLDRYTDELMKRGKCDPSFSYMLDTLLQSRIATDHESNSEYFDEDVNVYLSLLLNSMVKNGFHREAARYVAGYESDLPEILDQARTAVMKYRVYRINADYLLLQTGLFQVPGETDSVDTSLLSSIERGKTYYRFACSLTDRIPERYRPLSSVLAKLSYGFDTYREVLSFMRGEFLNLMEQLNERDMIALYADMDDIGRNEALHAARNALLDAYLANRKTPSEENRRRFEAALEALRKLDPDAGADLDLS